MPGIAAKNARATIGGSNATINRFDFDGSADEIDDSTFESTGGFSEWIAGLKDATLTLAGRWETPQAGLIVGDTVSVRLFWNKSGGAITPLMSTIITGYKVTGEVRGRIEFEGTFRVTGAF
jgi:hypothetical protein